MRFIKLLPALILALLLLLVIAYQGVNIVLQRGDGGAKISEFINHHLPGVRFRYATARLRPGLGGVFIRVDDAYLGSGDSFVSAPQADFWLRPGGGVVVLHAPQINLTGGDTALPLPTAGEWQIKANDATIRWHDAAAGVSLTLHNSLLLARQKKGQWRLQLDSEEKSRRLHARANLQAVESAIQGEIYAEFDGWQPPAALPINWHAAQVTVRATIDGGKVDWRAVGNWRQQPATTVRWHADGQWNTTGITAAVTVAAHHVPIPAAPQAPPAAVYISGTGHYESASGRWQWQSDKAVAVSKDGILRATADITGNGANITHAAANLRLIDLPAKSLSLYVTAGPVRQWFAKSITAGGIVENAHIAWRGTPTNPTIALTAAFSDVDIDIAPGWPPAQKLRGVVVLSGNDITASGAGMISGMAATDITVRIPDLTAERATIHLAAQFVRAPLTRYIAAAERLPPAQQAVQALTDDLSLSGDGKLSLSVSVPLAAPETATMRGRLAVHEGEADAGGGLPKAQRLNGIIHIDNDGTRATLIGQLHKQPLTVQFNNSHVAMHGTIDTTVALSLAGLQALPVTGTTSFTVRRDNRQTVIVSALAGAAIHLPPPLQKAASVSAALSVRLQAAQTEAQLQLADNMFYLTHHGGTDIAINDATQPPPAIGVNLHGTLAAIANADAWLPMATNAGGGAIAISLVIADSELLKMRHTALRVVSPVPVNNTRQFMLAGDRIGGIIFYRPGSVRASLSHLLLDDLQTAGNLNVNMQRLTVAVTVKSFTVGGADLGQLLIAGVPERNEFWQLTQLQLQKGRNTLHMAGRYAGYETNLTLNLSAPDAAGLIQTFGWNDVISEGEAQLTGNIKWPNTPDSFSLLNMSGHLKLQAGNLRYLKTDANIVSLLAIFSPQSLLSLGFTEIGKEGIRMDTLSGEIFLADGNAVFHDITMENKDINISLGGKTYLPEQTLDISGRVRPGHRLLNAGSVVSLGAGVAALSPVSLAAGFLLGKVFERPLSEIGAYNYTITGTWKDPQYTEVGTVVINPPDK